MPSDTGPPPEEQLDVFRDWILEGAKDN